MIRRQFCLGLPLIALFCGFSAAYDITGSKWPGAVTEFHVGIRGTSLPLLRWNDAFIDAAEEWNELTDFRFILRDDYRDPCRVDGYNGVDFTPTVCGSAYGNNTLAVTLYRFRESLLGPPDLIEADIVVNDAVDFGLYSGPASQSSLRGVDFRRVALHELGHVIGLGHESAAGAIMAPQVGDIDSVQPDDIAGVAALYGGLSSCVVNQLTFGTISADLGQGDCRVNELTSGGQDTSFVDVYRFELKTATAIQFAMSSSTVDPVLLLADADLNFFDLEIRPLGSCNSSLNITLDPGSYFLLTNTFDQTVTPACGTQGNYELSVQYTAHEPLYLGDSVSLRGLNNDALFAGGISANNGQSFGNTFRPSDNLDINARISPDPAHVGRAGFLVVGALFDGGVLLLNEQGSFIDYGSGGPLIKARQSILSETEDIVIVDDLVPNQIGIESIQVDFVAGYGLDSDPEEVFFHQTPMTLVVAPGAGIR